MSFDTLSVAAPARVKVLLLPLGQLRQSRFLNFVSRLRQENVVRLGDVSPDSRPHRTMFSPLAFPEGLVLYDLSTSQHPTSPSAVAPFELYRVPLIVAAIMDGKQNGIENHLDSEDGGFLISEGGQEMLLRSLDELKANFPAAMVHQIFVFDCNAVLSPLPKGVVPVPSPQKSRTTTIKTLMCDLTSLFLGEMTTYAKSLQALPSLDSPRITAGRISSNGAGSALPTHMVGFSRPTSAADRLRSFSPVGDEPRSSHRMSMPAHMPSSILSRDSTPDSRATSPPSGARTPPNNCDDIHKAPAVSPPSNLTNDQRIRGGSQDRESLGSFGPGSLGERERSKGKARVGVVTGSMYLLAGRWPDAMKELVQSASVARANSDYVWQAKALEYLLVCLLVCSWAGMDINIPDILRPGAERLSSGSSKAASHATSGSLPEWAPSKSTDPASRALTLESFTEVLPDLVNNILNLYARAWTFTEDKLPPLVFSHSTIRLVKLLTAIQNSNGQLDDTVLKHIVTNAHLPRREHSSVEAKVFLPKGELVSLLFRAYPDGSPESSMSVSDRTTVLASIASVLSDLGYHRKKALIFKELLTALLPALVQARKDGAAEMGVHPAASLVALNAAIGSSAIERSRQLQDGSKQGIQDFLWLVCQAYGITPRDWVDKSRQPTDTKVDVAFAQAVMNKDGSQELKTDILRACINICEALPDLAGALEYSAELLRTAGSGIAPGLESSNGAPDLPIEEQIRLANNISRTLSAAKHLGLRHPEADYWDEFLVRGIEIVDVDQSERLISHAKSELEIAENIEAKKEKNPFIYNPFLKANSSLVTERLLVANEKAVFQVMLQNLYDFDVSVERIRLESKGMSFDCPVQTLIIGPYRTQTILIGGVPKCPGSLTISGCYVKIRGCRERSFFNFPEAWALKADVKGRHFQVIESEDKKLVSTTASDAVKSKPPRPSQGPKATSLTFKVIDNQPIVSLKSFSLAQSAIMLLEGQRTVFSITLQNSSQTTPVDLLLLSFTDSATAQLQSTLASKELSAIELYELELSSSRKQAFRWHHKDTGTAMKILPSNDITLEVEILGKPGLSYGAIQVNYGYLGMPKEDIKDRFYTRQLKIPLTVTVNLSVDLVHSDVVPLMADLVSRKQLQPQERPENGQGDHAAENINAASIKNSNIESFLTRVDLSPTSTPHCLFLLDFRNSWPNTLAITIDISSDPLSPTSSTSTTTHTIHPGTTNRLPLPVPRLYLPTSRSHSPIPSLNAVTKRQFVISSTKSTPEAERSMRESFWYREEILKLIQARWREESSGREGDIEMRALRLNPRMVAALKLEDIEISMDASVAEPHLDEKETKATVKHIGTDRIEVPISTFMSLKTTIYNRSEESIRPLLRLQPRLKDQPHNIALDLGKKLLVNGVLQKMLLVLRPGETRSTETGFCVLRNGVYEWGACVEEVRGRVKGEKIGRERARTGDLDMLEGVGRRIWYAEVPLVVVARTEGNEEGIDIEGGDSDEEDEDEG